MEARKTPWLGERLHRLLLRLPPERAHGLGLAALRLGSRPGAANYLGSYKVEDPRLRRELLGRRFPNPLGLAAGFDKDGVAISGLELLGFGAIEVGTVTPRPQAGNPRPRLFRHRGAASLENAMGFNNAGAAALERRLRRRIERSGSRQGGTTAVPLGVNVGKNKTTPNEAAVAEYAGLVRRFDGLCDYFVVNISSPNTPGLRDLETPRTVERLLAAARGETTSPVLVKLSPDLETAQAVELALSAVEAGAAGVILTNTTIDYSLLPEARRIGGLSGRVLRERSLEVLRAVAPRVFGRALLVSVGGVDSGRELYRRLRAGAGLVQIYTALAFGGPATVARMLTELLDCLERDGLGSVEGAVGADLRQEERTST